MDPRELPIRKFSQQLLRSLKDHDTAVVIGEAGSGKTTQIPQILRDAGYANDGVIAITQPRRVAAISAARRVAQEIECPLGSEVGYSVRFDEISSPETRIKYLTDGTLLRESLLDPELNQYSVIMLDEAHERGLSTDILFGVIREFQEKRTKPVKVLITSATLDGEKFSAYFGGCPVLSVPGSCYPVEIIHSTEDHMEKYAESAVEVALDIHENQPPGDILLFMTGQSEINKVVKRLNDGISSMGTNACGPLQVLPLYAALPMEQQALVFSPCPDGCRRCIVATNIAETSLTVDGIVYVIDPGTVKQKLYHPETGMDSLDVVTISKVQAKQRAGRAGRTRAGVCYRLYSKRFYEKSMSEAGLPEIQRASLVSTVLYLKTLNIGIDILRFKYLDAPEMSQLEDALRQLYVLEAIDADGNVTDVGREMSKLPVDPALARALLASVGYGCLRQMMIVAAMLSVENVFVHSQNSFGQHHNTEDSRSFVRKLTHEGLGDHVLFLRIFEEWEKNRFAKYWCEEQHLDYRALRFARDVYYQLERMMSKTSMEKKPSAVERSRKRKRHTAEHLEQNSRPYSALRRALVMGFSNRIAHRMATHNGYRPFNPGSSLAQLHPSSAKVAVDEEGLLPEWIVYHEHIVTSRPFLKKVCPVEADWVNDALPRLRFVDVRRLSGGQITKETRDSSFEAPKATASPAMHDCAQRKNTDEMITCARQRYLERKAAKDKLKPQSTVRN